MAKQFCTNCGKEYEGDFCTYCGTKGAPRVSNASNFSSPISRQLKGMKTGVPFIDNQIADKDPQQVLAAACIMISALIMLISMLVCYFVWKSYGHWLALGRNGSDTAGARAVMYNCSSIWFMLIFLLGYLASCAFALKSIFDNKSDLALMTLIGQIGAYLLFWILVAIFISVVKNNPITYIPYATHKGALSMLGGANQLPKPPFGVGFMSSLYMGCATYFTSFCWTLPTWLASAALLTMSRKG